MVHFEIAEVTMVLVKMVEVTMVQVNMFEKPAHQLCGNLAPEGPKISSGTTLNMEELEMEMR